LYEICVSRAADKIKQMDEAPVTFGVSESKFSSMVCFSVESYIFVVLFSFEKFVE